MIFYFPSEVWRRRLNPGLSGPAHICITELAVKRPVFCGSSSCILSFILHGCQAHLYTLESMVWKYLHDGFPVGVEGALPMSCDLPGHSLDAGYQVISMVSLALGEVPVPITRTSIDEKSNRLYVKGRIEIC